MKVRRRNPLVKKWFVRPTGDSAGEIGQIVSAVSASMVLCKIGGDTILLPVKDMVGWRFFETNPSEPLPAVVTPNF